MERAGESVYLARRYAASLGLVAMATLARWAVGGLVETRAPWVFYFPAISIAAWQFGAGPGVLAVVLSTIAGLYFWVAPVHSLAVSSTQDIYVVLAFLVSGAVMVAFGGSNQITRRHLHEVRKENEETEQELAESLEAFRGILDHAQGDAVILMDPKRTIVAWNVGAERIFGYPSADAVGQRVDLIFVPDDRSAGVPEAETSTASRLGVAPDERWLIRKDGSRLWANGSLMALHHQDGNVRGYLKILRDETARHSLEQERKSHSEALERHVAEQTADLRAANAELEGFTYSVSHDMRAPLRAIIANASILLDEHGAELSPDAVQRLERVAAAGKRMGLLVEDLLTYARLNKQEVRRAPCDIAELFREVYAEEFSAIPAEITAPPSLIAECEPGLMRMVMQNLVGNAVKYRRPEILLRLELREVPHDDQRGFEVRDNGIGFEMQYVVKLFEPFERLHRNEEYPGTGIGLANVKRIIERHGGRVWARGEPGVGATFGFTLGE